MVEGRVGVFEPLEAVHPGELIFLEHKPVFADIERDREAVGGRVVELREPFTRAQLLLEGLEIADVGGVVGVRAGPGPGLVPVHVVEHRVVGEPIHAAIVGVEGHLHHHQVIGVHRADAGDQGLGVGEPLVHVGFVDQVVADDGGLVAIARRNRRPQVLQALLEVRAAAEVLESGGALIAPRGHVHVQDQPQPIGPGPLHMAIHHREALVLVDTGRRILLEQLVGEHQAHAVEAECTNLRIGRRVDVLVAEVVAGRGAVVAGIVLVDIHALQHHGRVVGPLHQAVAAGAHQRVGVQDHWRLIADLARGQGCDVDIIHGDGLTLAAADAELQVIPRGEVGLVHAVEGGPAVRVRSPVMARLIAVDPDRVGAVLDQAEEQPGVAALPRRQAHPGAELVEGPVSEGPRVQVVQGAVGAPVVGGVDAQPAVAGLGGGGVQGEGRARAAPTERAGLEAAVLDEIDAGQGAAHGQGQGREGGQG